MIYTYYNVKVVFVLCINIKSEYIDNYSNLSYFLLLFSTLRQFIMKKCILNAKKEEKRE